MGAALSTTRSSRRGGNSIPVPAAGKGAQPQTPNRRRKKTVKLKGEEEQRLENSSYKTNRRRKKHKIESRRRRRRRGQPAARDSGSYSSVDKTYRAADRGTCSMWRCSRLRRQSRSAAETTAVAHNRKSPARYQRKKGITETPKASVWFFQRVVPRGKTRDRRACSTCEHTDRVTAPPTAAAAARQLMHLKRLKQLLKRLKHLHQ